MVVVVCLRAVTAPAAACVGQYKVNIALEGLEAVTGTRRVKVAPIYVWLRTGEWSRIES